jgi:hypothetical protein
MAATIAGAAVRPGAVRDRTLAACADNVRPDLNADQFVVVQIPTPLMPASLGHVPTVPEAERVRNGSASLLMQRPERQRCGCVSV